MTNTFNVEIKLTQTFLTNKFLKLLMLTCKFLLKVDNKKINIPEKVNHRFDLSDSGMPTKTIFTSSLVLYIETPFPCSLKYKFHSTSFVHCFILIKGFSCSIVGKVNISGGFILQSTVGSIFWLLDIDRL